MAADWKKAYRQAFDKVYSKVAGGMSPTGPGGAPVGDLGASPGSLPDPGILVRLYTGTLKTGRKKRLGVFYTPPEIVRFMCRESLAHYLSNSTGLSLGHALGFISRMTADIQDGQENGRKGQDDSPEIDRGLLLKADRALETARIFDPAVGCGAFVCGMLDEIVKLRCAIAVHLANGCGHAGDSSFKNHPFMLRYKAIANSLHGADIDETAVEITRLRLWHGLITELERCGNGDGTDGTRAGTGESVTAGACITAAAMHDLQDPVPGPGDFRCSIVCADSLFEHDVRGFDIVIGNPPYVSAVEGARNGRDLRLALKKKFPQLKGAFDIYAAFLLDGIRRLNEKGVYCWIVPNRLLVSRYAAPVMEHLKENGLRYTVSISDIRVFSGVGVYPVIVAGNMCRAPGKEVTGPTGSGENATDGKSPEDHREYYAGSLQQLCGRRFVIRPGVKQYGTFAEHGIKIASGAAGFQADMLRQYIAEAPCAAGRATHGPDVCCSGCNSFIPFAVSGSIDRYRLDRSKVRYMGTVYKNPCIRRGEKIAESKWKLWCSEKICIAGLTREPEAYYSREPLALGVGAYAIHGFGGMDPYYLLALLNSRFMSWYLRERFYERHLSGGYLAINKFILEQLPLARADRETEQEIARRAERLQQTSCGGTEAKKLQSEIDEMVSMIYSHKFIP